MKGERKKVNQRSHQHFYFNGALFWQNINLVFLMVVLTIHSGPKYLPAKAGGMHLGWFTYANPTFL